MTAFDWPQMFRDVAKACHWTPQQILEEMTFAQFLVTWCGAGERRGSHNPQGVRDQINRRRAARGLSPMKPAKR